ncbi:ParA family protein [Pseudomonas putida]
MQDDISQELRRLLQEHHMSLAQAGDYGGVAARTWQTYETASENSSRRKPSKHVIRSFFRCSGIRMPEFIRAQLLKAKQGYTVAITAFSGGIGKSPITVAVAATLASLNYRVAIVSSDAVFRTYVFQGKGPQPGSFASQIAFFDYADVVFSPSEVKGLKAEVKEQGGVSELEKDLTDDIWVTSRSLLRRKEQATTTLKTLRANFDFVFFDINREVGLLRAHADLILVVLDSHSRESVWSAERFYQCLLNAKAKTRMPKCHGLITRYDLGVSGIELNGYLYDIQMDDAHQDEMWETYFDWDDYLQENHALIRELPFQMLNTRLTSAHRSVIQRYNHGKHLSDTFCHFDTVLDAAPNSAATDEIMRLVDELLDVRL